MFSQKKKKKSRILVDYKFVDPKHTLPSMFRWGVAIISIPKIYKIKIKKDYLKTKKLG